MGYGIWMKEMEIHAALGYYGLSYEKPNNIVCYILLTA